MGKDAKIEKLLTPEQAAGLVAVLVDATQTGTELGLIPVQDLRELKLIVKKEAEGFVMKIRTKSSGVRDTEEPLEDEEDGDELSSREVIGYKALKKRMQKNFRTIRKSRDTGLLPRASEVDRFLRDARTMISFHERGENYYDPFIKACETLGTTFSEGDIETFVGTIDEIDKIRGHCHREHK